MEETESGFTYSIYWCPKCLYTRKVALGWSELSVGGLLLVGLLASMLFFLYALVLSGPWFLFLWAAGLSLSLVLAIKLFTLCTLNAKRQLEVAAMLWELLSGAFGWTWMALGVISVVLFFRALLFSGPWSDFFACLVASAVCKSLTRFCMMCAAGAAFKRDLVAKGLTKKEARKAWIVRSREIL